MWYFSWILGVTLAASLAILNAIWYELYVSDYGKERVDE
ncbi:MAG: cytochrome bd-I oxidase subunit CydX [Legionellales bacterium]|nr:cytochrome bd-I oxidase subunit CydX [Legionellales bacterium]|tara:strand:- start:98 stop:214 length:117 start_codon:yes stop_codon:yes gene_type:complete